MPSPNTLRVLIVEDEATDAEILRRSLQRLEVSSLEVFFAHTGKEAKLLLGQGSYDLLLMDLHLPDVVEFELIREAKKIQKNVPVVVVTSLNSHDAALEVGRIGADDYIVKDELLGSSLGRTVRRLLRPRFQHDTSRPKPRLMEEASDQIDTWLAWRFPQHIVPPIPPSKEVMEKSREQYGDLLKVSLQKQEADLRRKMSEFEKYCFENKIPAESLIAIHREMTDSSRVKDDVAGRQRFLLFELLAALFERYRSTESGEAAAGS